MQHVIVDRDTLMVAGDAADGSSELDWETVPGSLEALARLSGAGFRLVVVCNQPDLGRKRLGIESLNALHHRMQHALLEAGGSFDAVFFCSCQPREECDCQMPNPGMLLDIATRLRVALTDVALIAGSEAAVQAAEAAGARPMLIDSAAKAAAAASRKHDVERYPDLDSAIDSLLTETAET